MNQFDLTGKVAVITGSSRGIGRAIAEAMADHGARVVISSRKAEACAEAAWTPALAGVTVQACLANSSRAIARLWTSSGPSARRKVRMPAQA